MTAVNIPDEALHHAREAFVRGRAGRSGVAAAVEAAAPLILAAELDRLIEALDAKAKEAGIGGSIYAHGRDDGLESAANLLRRRAAELRGEG